MSDLQSKPEPNPARQPSPGLSSAPGGDREPGARRPVGPVMQFALLIVPMVMSCFFLVYALTGWVLEGRDRLNWQLEAESVALWVGLGIIGYAVLTALYARLRGASRWHPLVVSGLGHAVVALLLMMSILVAIRL